MDSLKDIFGNPEQFVRDIQNTSNQWAALQAQNSDIASGKWTLNNAVFQYSQLSPAGQFALMAAAAWIISELIKKA